MDEEDLSAFWSNCTFASSRAWGSSCVRMAHILLMRLVVLTQGTWFRYVCAPRAKKMSFERTQQQDLIMPDSSFGIRNHWLLELGQRLARLCTGGFLAHSDPTEKKD